MSEVNFDDLLDIRKGGENLTMGGGPSRIEKIATPEEWKVRAGALREIFLQTLGHAPDVSCPLSPEVIDEVDCGDHLRRRIAYFVEPDEKISAYVLIPRDRKGRRPAVLSIHGTTPFGKEQGIGNEPDRQDCAHALHLVRRGYVTLAYDLLSAGERAYRGLRAFDTAPFYERHPAWSIRGKDLWDVGRAVDLLQTLEEVDPERIGSIGHSQGGGITLHAMGLDSRIRAGVSNCGDWPSRFSRNPFNHCRTGWWVGRPFLRPYAHSGKPFPIDLHEYLALIAPRAILNIVALNDWSYTVEEEPLTRPVLERLADAVSGVFSLLGAGGQFRQVLHTRGHSFLQEQREIAYAFLDEKLKG